MHALEQKLYQSLCRHQLLATPFFLACSGGQDSLSLAFACVRLYGCGKLSQLPTLIHVHHGLQACADEWASLVADFAKAYHLPYIIKSICLSDGSEQSAREGRYQAFFECVKGDATLLMAHHQDDQAETVLMRLIHGTGLAGLVAMQECSQKQEAHQCLTLIRPWLDITRQQISDYAHEYQLTYVDDPTNTIPNANSRAFIRTHLKQQLHALNPKAYANIARTAHVLKNDYDIVQTHLQTHLERTVSKSPFVLSLDIAHIDTLDVALQFALIHQFAKCELFDSPTYRLTNDLVCLALRHDSNHQSTFFWQASSKGFVFYRYKSLLYRYEHHFWQALQSDMVFDIKENVGVFDWQAGKLGVRFLMDVTDIQKINPITSVLCHARTKQLRGKKLYQYLGIAYPYRRNLWHITSLQGDFVLGVGRVWSLDDQQPCVQFWQIFDV